MAYPQGAVVLAEDPFGNTAMRPYLICSNSQVPFHGEEYLAAIITTTRRNEAIKLTADRFEAGRLPRQSYISPWAILTLKEWMITKQPAVLTADTVDDVRDAVDGYLQT